MGYSVAVHCKNSGLKSDMMDFMDSHYQNAHLLFGTRVTSQFTDSLSYEHGKLSIGFDYGTCSELEMHYIYCIVAWVGIKVGKLKKFPVFGTCPYYAYDGESETPISSIATDEHMAVDDLGYSSLGYGLEDPNMISAMNYLLPNDLTIDKVDELILAELKSLEHKWEVGE